MNFKKATEIVKIATIGIIIYLVCFGIAMAFFPIRPFWNDEWRLIYNLKFKTESKLWGTLDLLQQCPRVYLTVLKKISSSFDYSYTSLRLPALVIGISNIFFCFYLRKKIFPNNSMYSYLFILILISSQTFTDYLVQVKQYEMDIFLCLLALWQLLTLLDISENIRITKFKYFLLCFSFVIAPFFSYTYPIAIAPVFLAIMFSSVVSSKTNNYRSARSLLLLYMPLVLTAISIVIFYCIDVKQLMADNSMYWSYRKMLGHITDEHHFAENFWNLFSLVGSGCLYEIIFGIAGIASFLYGAYRLAKTKGTNYTRDDYFRLYGIVLLILTLYLILMGKLMGSVARLTAFTVPSISILIVSFLDDIKAKYHKIKVANIAACILFVGLYGNIISTCINTFTYREYRSRIKTYWQLSHALKQARLDKVPILITDGVRGDKIDSIPAVPGKVIANAITAEQIAGADTLCGEVVLKDHPEYKTWDPVPVYTIPDTKWIHEYMQQLPPNIKSAIVCDGLTFVKVNR